MIKDKLSAEKTWNNFAISLKHIDLDIETSTYVSRISSYVGPGIHN